MGLFSPPASASSGPDITGTPNAGEYARFADANTLEARTTAQVLSDIGAAPLASPTFSGDITLSDADAFIVRGDNDGYTLLGGGTGSGDGAYCYLSGNDRPGGEAGDVVFSAGNVATGLIAFFTNDTSRLQLNYDGTVTVHATTLASIRDQVIRTGYYAVAWTATPASGYLNADGSAVSRDTYAALFAVIGTTFGVGDGSTTFNLPDASGLNTNDIYLHIKT